MAVTTVATSKSFRMNTGYCGALFGAGLISDYTLALFGALFTRQVFLLFRPDLMRDRKRKTAFFDLDFSIRKKYIAFLKIR